MLTRFLGTVVVAAAALCFAAHAQDDCKLKRIAALDLRVGSGGRIEVPVTMGGQPLSLIVDTGSGHSMIAERAANALGFKQISFPNSVIRMWGGARINKFVHVDDIQLGKVVLGRSELLVIPDTYMGAGSDGLLGADIMSRFDADFDFGNGKLNFISQDHCAGKVIYWTDEANVAIVPFHKTPLRAEFAGYNFKKILFTVIVDGKEFRAALDTGAHFTSMNMEAANSAFDLTPESPDMVAMKRRGGTSYRHHFKTLSFGGVATSNPEIVLDPYEVNKLSGSGPQMLIGMNILRKLHLYVAYKEEKLYISPATATK